MAVVGENDEEEYLSHEELALTGYEATKPHTANEAKFAARRIARAAAKRPPKGYWWQNGQYE